MEWGAMGSSPGPAADGALILAGPEEAVSPRLSRVDRHTSGQPGVGDGGVGKNGLGGAGFGG